MNQLYNAVRSKTQDLIFVDSNFYAQDPTTFSYQPLSSSSNLAYVFHYYPCQSSSQNQQVCYNQTPEECAQIETGTNGWYTFGLSDYLTNNGVSWNYPVVFDEFGFPAGAEANGQPIPAGDTFYVNSTSGSTLNIYGYGLELANVAYYLQSEKVGWSAFAWGINSGGPWQQNSQAPNFTPNADGAAIEAALSDGGIPPSQVCTNPPFGYV